MTTRRPQTRLASVDVLRAIAIVLMTVVHFVENLAGSWDVVDGIFLGASRYWWLPTGFAAPMFTFLSGASYRLWADAQRARGRTDAELTKITLRRGLFLILLGFAFNVLVWMPEDVFNWDILALIGIATLALDVARRVPAAVPLTACGLLVALAPPLRVLADYHTAWCSGFFEYDFVLGDEVRGCLVNGYFSVFPWLALPLAGFVAAPLLYGGVSADDALCPGHDGRRDAAGSAAALQPRCLVHRRRPVAPSRRGDEPPLALALHHPSRGASLAALARRLRHHGRCHGTLAGRHAGLDGDLLGGGLPVRDGMDGRSDGPPGQPFDGITAPLALRTLNRRSSQRQTPQQGKDQQDDQDQADQAAARTEDGVPAAKAVATSEQ